MVLPVVSLCAERLRVRQPARWAPVYRHCESKRSPALRVSAETRTHTRARRWASGLASWRGRGGIPPAPKHSGKCRTKVSASTSLLHQTQFSRIYLFASYFVLIWLVPSDKLEKFAQLCVSSKRSWGYTLPSVANLTIKTSRMLNEFPLL
jgi:hypothetical protein